MRPAALIAVASALRDGALPTVREYPALLVEVGCTGAEAANLVERYAAATAPAMPSGEAGMLPALRGFSLG